MLNVNESGDQISRNQTMASINEGTEVNSLIEEYERINDEASEDTQEKIEKMKIILEKLKKFESENTMLSDIITDLEGKIIISQSYFDQDKEIEKMINKGSTEASALVLAETENEEKIKNEIRNYHYAIYNKYEDDEKESEFPRLTDKFINKFLCTNYKLYYRTHELNECLYLHFKGFRMIENLDTFTNLKVLYMEGNSIKKIAGLDKLVNLVSLYLHQNLIEKIEGLDNLKNLFNLNLSENCIQKVENLGQLPQLTNLLLKRNRIGLNGLDDISELKELKAVTVVDLSENRIDDKEVLEVLEVIPDLRVIYLQGNECIRKIPHYRKVMITTLKQLRYLDDKPVFEDERRFAEAFATGGLEGEKKERELYRKEKQDAELQRITDFQEMINGWKGKGKDENISDKENFILDKEKEMEKEEQKRKLLMKCKSKSNKMEIREEIVDLNKLDVDNLNSVTGNNQTGIFNEDYDLPDLEAVKSKKQEGYIEYILEKEKHNLENMIDPATNAVTINNDNTFITTTSNSVDIVNSSDRADKFNELD